jgi:hypothetical protein
MKPPTIDELHNEILDEVSYRTLGNMVSAVYHRASDDTFWQLDWDSNEGMKYGHTRLPFEVDGNHGEESL